MLGVNQLLSKPLFLFRGAKYQYISVFSFPMSHSSPQGVINIFLLFFFADSSFFASLLSFHFGNSIFFDCRDHFCSRLVRKLRPNVRFGCEILFVSSSTFALNKLFLDGFAIRLEPKYHYLGTDVKTHTLSFEIHVCKSSRELE